ncbi:hypothetical protein D3C78_759470 [compost metagenome]
MTQAFETAIKASIAQLSHYIDIHKARPNVNFAEHVRQKRMDLASRVSTKKLVYLDTNAWKCIADFREGKSNLTSAMSAFALSLERAAQSGAFVFPIGLPTFFELDSMTSPATRGTLSQLVDDLSQGFCIAPFQDRVGTELHKLRMGDLHTPEGPENFLCSPVELLGIPKVSFPDFIKAHVEEETFNKAFFDTIAELPLSMQLEIAASAPGVKWDNSRNIADLNAGKDGHWSGIENLNTGIFVELKGCIGTWFAEEGITISSREIGIFALNALYHWDQMPSSRALPTLCVLSSLYGLMRFDPQRRYRNGDPNDFMVAASALPIANALFTDRKLANLLSDKRIGFNRFSNCAVVSGFDEMAEYLELQV